MKRIVVSLFSIIFILFSLSKPVLGQETAEEYFTEGCKIYEHGNLEKAEEYFKKAIVLNPDYAEAYYNIAIVYWEKVFLKKKCNSNEADAIMKCLSKALASNPNDDVRKIVEDNLEIWKRYIKEGGQLPSLPTESIPKSKKILSKEEIEELLDQMRFGVTSVRRASVKSLQESAIDPKVVIALRNLMLKQNEELDVRTIAVDILAGINTPQARAVVVEALKLNQEGMILKKKLVYNAVTKRDEETMVQTKVTDTIFPTEKKKEWILALSKQKDKEAFATTLEFWLMDEWAEVVKEDTPSEMKRKDWIAELNDPKMYELTKELGGEILLPDLVNKWRGETETTFFKIKDDAKLYYAYYALMMGVLGGNRGIDVLRDRLRKDYPGGSVAEKDVVVAPGAQVTPILKVPAEQKDLMPVLVSLNLDEETKLRTEIVRILGNVGGETLTPFFGYLAKNDPQIDVRNATQSALGVLKRRIDDSVEFYNKGVKLQENDDLDGALKEFRSALKNNPDTVYGKDIDKAFVKIGVKFLVRKDNEKAKPLFSSVIMNLPQVQLSSKTETDTGGIALMTITETSDKKRDENGIKKAKELILKELNKIGVNSTELTQESQNTLLGWAIELKVITIRTEVTTTNTGGQGNQAGGG